MSYLKSNQNEYSEFSRDDGSSFSDSDSALLSPIDAPSTKYRRPSDTELGIISSSPKPNKSRTSLGPTKAHVIHRRSPSADRDAVRSRSDSMPSMNGLYKHDEVEMEMISGQGEDTQGLLGGQEREAPYFRKSFNLDRPSLESEDVDVGDVKALVAEALPSLLISIGGLVLAGWLLDVMQHWKVFVSIPELFILVPVLLNLKGNLEMNLAARFSTSANLGDLDYRPTRNSLVSGNLLILQLQALIVGSIAGLFSFILGIIFNPHDSMTYFESMLMITSSMICAALSSLILGVFMCALIILCRWGRINPDNIACPMASSLGDLVTLIILATIAHLLLARMETWLSTALFLGCLAALPLFARFVWRNKFVRELLFVGWTPILVAMVISSMAGLMLENYIEMYKGLAMLTPVLNGLAGNLGSIYASRISTCLHAGKEENYGNVESTLLLMNIPTQIVFLGLIWAGDLGGLTQGGTFGWFAGVYFFVSMICTLLTLSMGKYLTHWFWRRKMDPDNYVLPYLTAIIDVIGTTLLVACFAALGKMGIANMLIVHEGDT